MLRLNDPLWKKLDDAHRDRNIPKLLSELAKTWDDEAAKSLFWDCLCHQETCYGATYAVIPHLLKIAAPKKNRQQRLEIAHFLGFVVLCARRRREDSSEVEDEWLQGLPETPYAWERKLDCFRSLAESYAEPDSAHYEKTVLLPRYQAILEAGPVDYDDLDKIEMIRADFFSALPAIRATCERALLENLEREHEAQYLLSGIAAADGLLNLAQLLNFGKEGRMNCTSCGWRHRYMLFGERVAVDADDRPPSKPRSFLSDEDPAFLDYKDGTPSRCDGFVVPVRDTEVADHRITALLSLADRAADTVPALLLRNFLGSYRCSKCSVQGPIQWR